MPTFIHYATPPGWRDRSLPPGLARVHVPNAPALRRRPAPRPAPEPRRNPSEYDGPQDDPKAAATELGLPWWGYAVALALITVALVVAVAREADPIIGAPIVLCWWASFRGMIDYARRGADR